jgi:DNA-binding response OmpR family regulator
MLNTVGTSDQVMKDREKILLVDDDPQLRQLLGDRLEASGYHVIFAANGREGIAKVRHEKPDVVLLDLEMPAMNGMAVLTEIRRFNTVLPVIMLTAHGTMAKEQEAWQCGANEFLAKSSTLSQLLLALKEVLMHKVG